MSEVINLGLQRRTRPREGVSIWSVGDLAPGKPNAWLKEVIVDSPYQSVALALWAHQPNLKAATEKLGALLTPKWPTPQGASLLRETVNRAVQKVDEAISRGESFEGRITGIYLFWLSQCVTDVARVVIYGVNDLGEQFRWGYFQEPLASWSKKNHFVHLEAVLQDFEPTEEMIAGLRTHLVAHISTPQDAGYLEMYAPRG